MNIRVRQIIDKLVIANIYIILVLDFTLLVKLIFVLTLGFYLIIILNNNKFNKRAFIFILFVYLTFSLLALVGLVKGNEVEDIVKFMLPILTLLNIFVYIELLKTYKLDRYIYHIYIASIFVTLKVLLLLLLFTNGILIDYLPVFDSEKVQNTWIGYNAGSFRIFIGQAIIIPVGLLLSQYFNKKIPYLFLVIAFVSLFFTQTTVLWVSYFLVLIYLLHLQFKSILKYIVLFLTFSGIVFIIGIYYDVIIMIIEEKLLYSAPVKLQQIGISIDILDKNLFFGGGLGYIFDNGANTIEVVILHVLSTTGILGFFIYTYMLFYWQILSIQYIKTDKLIFVLVLSYLTIVFASFSNPYLLGGSSGLFLIPFIAARFIYLKKERIYRVYNGN
jgi:hypothetical protein